MSSLGALWTYITLPLNNGNYGHDVRLVWLQTLRKEIGTSPGSVCVCWISTQNRFHKLESGRGQTAISSLFFNVFFNDSLVPDVTSWPRCTGRHRNHGTWCRGVSGCRSRGQSTAHRQSQGANEKAKERSMMRGKTLITPTSKTGHAVPIDHLGFAHFALSHGKNNQEHEFNGFHLFLRRYKNAYLSGSENTQICGGCFVDEYLFGKRWCLCIHNNALPTRPWNHRPTVSLPPPAGPSSLGREGLM